MDEVAPRIRRSDRPMVRPDTGHAIDGRRRTLAGLGPLGPGNDGDLTLGRRIGVLVVLAALGGAILLAASGGSSDHAVAPMATHTPAPTIAVAATAGTLAVPPTGVPVIRTPKVPLTKSRTIDLRVTVPDPGTTPTGLEVRVYRNSRLLKSQSVTESGRIKVEDVPLRRGLNKLTATLANPGGEGPRSGIVTITVDDQPPKVIVKSPRNGTTLNDSQITVRGKTDAGLTVSAKNLTSGRILSMTTGSLGVFAFDVGLSPGRNDINLRTKDAAGNIGTTRLVIVRGDGRPSADLRISRKKVRVKDLPATINARVTVRDADGRPIKGVPVTFTMSPPGQLTTTYATTTGRDGTASWSGIRLPRSGTTLGAGIVTARAILPSGGVAADQVHFQVK